MSIQSEAAEMEAADADLKKRRAELAQKLNEAHKELHAKKVTVITIALTERELCMLSWGLSASSAQDYQHRE